MPPAEGPEILHRSVAVPKRAQVAVGVIRFTDNDPGIIDSPRTAAAAKCSKIAHAAVAIYECMRFEHVGLGFAHDITTIVHPTPRAEPAAEGSDVRQRSIAMKKAAITIARITLP